MISETLKEKLREDWNCGAIPDHIYIRAVNAPSDQAAYTILDAYHDTRHEDTPEQIQRRRAWLKERGLSQ